MTKKKTTVSKSKFANIASELKERFVTLATADGLARMAIGATVFVVPTLTVQALGAYLLVIGALYFFSKK